MHNGKLRLNLEDLSVESFMPADEVQLLGTVKGQEDTADGMTYCARTQCMETECIQYSCKWTECQNISCQAGNGCGSGTESLPGQYTCQVQCHTNPPPIE